MSVVWLVLVHILVLPLVAKLNILRPTERVKNGHIFSHAFCFSLSSRGLSRTNLISLCSLQFYWSVEEFHRDILQLIISLHLTDVMVAADDFNAHLGCLGRQNGKYSFFPCPDRSN